MKVQKRAGEISLDAIRGKQPDGGPGNRRPGTERFFHIKDEVGRAGGRAKPGKGKERGKGGSRLGKLGQGGLLLSCLLRLEPFLTL